MTRYLTRRVLQGVLTLWIMLTLTFIFVEVVIPGDFVSQFAWFMTPAEMAALRAELGLDLPAVQRYFLWISGLPVLDFEESFLWGGPVLDLIVDFGSASLMIFLLGIAVAYTVGIGLGRVMAWRGRGPVTEMTSFVAISFYAFFPPALAYILFHIFATELRWFPRSTELFFTNFTRDFRAPPSEFLPQMVLALMAALALTLVVDTATRRIAKIHVPPLVYLPFILLFWAVGWIVAGIFVQGAMLAWGAIIPLVTFILLTTGEMIVISRTSMNEVLHDEYIETARAKGLKPARIRRKHAGRNAILPVLSRMVISVPYLFGGLAIIEFALDWPGMGAATFDAAINQDYPVLLGFMAVIGTIALLCRLGLDTAYAFLDPRIRYDRRSS